LKSAGGSHATRGRLLDSTAVKA